MKLLLTFKAVALSIAIFSFCSSNIVAQTQRGVGVRIKTETGQMLDLYDASAALVIGVSDYDKGWRKLPGVKVDVKEVSRVLAKSGFETTSILNPTREEFDAALRQFIAKYGLRERNRLVIYFAGHGHTERLSDDRDMGYIVMRNAPRPDDDPAQFSLSAVSMDDINAYALRIKSKHALFVFDSCFAGSIFRSESSRRIPPKIASFTAGPVRQFITAGAANQEVPDDSIFRHYFVRAFESSEADLDEDGFVTGEELGRYLSGSVSSDSRDVQTPRFGKIRDARLNIGDLVFVSPKVIADLTVSANSSVKPDSSKLATTSNEISSNALGKVNDSEKPLISNGAMEPGFKEKSYAAKQLRFPVGSSDGRLVIQEKQVAFQAMGDTRRSRIWELKEIKSLRLTGPYRLKLEPFIGDTYTVDLLGEGMTPSEFKALQDRVANARLNKEPVK